MKLRTVAGCTLAGLYMWGSIMWWPFWLMSLPRDVLQNGVLGGMAVCLVVPVLIRVVGR